MDCVPRKYGDALGMPDYMPKERDCFFPGSSPGKTSDEYSLELTLGPPGENRGNHGTRSPFPSLGHCHPSNSYLQLSPGNRTFADHEESSQQGRVGDEPKGVYFALPLPPVNTAAMNNISQNRSAPAAVVGWPPIRSFRKNLASASSAKQPGQETRNVASNKAIDGEKPTAVPPKGLFVKINMDGVPIGRKVDIRSCESYEKLATMVDVLFRSLLAAQTDCSGLESSTKPITGLLDGTGEYTLVYEDHEGDRVLVGDVPWEMFVATARRLRVLKRSDLSFINRESCNRPC